MYFVYILESESTGKLYIGQTTEPDKRLHDHNRGASPYTKNKGPWKRLHLSQFETKTEAILLENINNFIDKKIILKGCVL